MHQARDPPAQLPQNHDARALVGFARAGLDGLGSRERGAVTSQNRSVSTRDRAKHRYREKRTGFWDSRATARRPRASGYYHQRLRRLYRFHIPPGLRVIELGCGEGDLLAAVAPAYGLGVDFSPVAVEEARRRHPELHFVTADVHDIDLGEKFDVVIVSDLVNDAWDVQRLFERVSDLCHPGTRVVLNTFNKLWQLPMTLASSMGLAQKNLKQNWLSIQDLRNLFSLAGLETITVSGEILWPVRTPVLDLLFNRFVVKLWPFKHLALTHFVIARPEARRAGSAVQRDAHVSVVVPARNEAGHIEEILERLPQMGSRTEIIFVEGNSTDDTLAVIKTAVERRNDPDIRYYQQPGKGKGDAVRWGFQHATGDVLMILDADMTVAPEDLPRFFDALADGRGELINGVRLVYPMEEQAMQFLNYLGNKFFGLTFSWLLGQPVKDTLCGTKVLSRSNYELIAANRAYFGDFDPFGDFDLLFGAAKANLKITDLPIRYRQRRYGSTNIDRWRHGVLLLQMAGFAARKLRFI